MKISKIAVPSRFPSQLAMLVLASAISVPAMAQQAPSSTEPQSTPPAAVQQPSPSASSANTDKEGFWGHLNPFARKKWVKKRLDPINDRLTELDQVNAKNASDIKDVDARAQAGIRQAQSTADSANELATTAGNQAQQANGLAQGASSKVDQLHSTVNGLDSYKQVSDVDVAFRSGTPALSSEAKKQLDDLATNLQSRKGYILEMEAHSPMGGAAGIQSSERLAEAVQRYLVTEHQIPVYRMHYVAMGNAKVTTPDSDTPQRVRHSSVHIRLMENSLAAQDDTAPHAMASASGAER
ncbi:MAG: OmpA family protein [Acidobacteriota bacterium]|nr:OmpA family protein [Acidobacteriota bacterium]